jgi:predicted nuclease of predicted toxin-antitoxin system
VTLSFLLDEDLSYRVAQGLRRRGVDTVSVIEVDRGNRRIPDEEQLRYASAERRVLVTYNRADYQALDAQWRLEGLTHSGIVWCAERSIPRRAIGNLVRALEALASQHESLTGVYMFLPHP